MTPDTATAAPWAAPPSKVRSAAEQTDPPTVTRSPETRAWYDAGLRHGIELGRELEAAERDAEWIKIATPIARGGQPYADLERRRWTLRGEPRTRETFGLPHPDDFPGRREAA